MYTSTVGSREVWKLEDLWVCKVSNPVWSTCLKLLIHSRHEQYSVIQFGFRWWKLTRVRAYTIRNIHWLSKHSSYTFNSSDTNKESNVIYNKETNTESTYNNDNDNNDRTYMLKSTRYINDNNNFDQYNKNVGTL